MWRTRTVARLAGFLGVYVSFERPLSYSGYGPVTIPEDSIITPKTLIQSGLRTTAFKPKAKPKKPTHKRNSR